MAEIIITQNDRRRQVTAIGGETQVTFDFPIFESDQILVQRTVSAVTTTLVLNVDYTVSGVGVQAGGTVLFDSGVFPSGLTAGDIITMTGESPIKRETDFQTVGDFFAADINRELDVITIVQQELDTKIERTIHIRPEDTTTPETDLLLPLPADRASQFLAFDSTGAVIIAPPGTIPSLPVTAFSASLLDNPTVEEWLEDLLNATPVTLDVAAEIQWGVRHQFTRQTYFPKTSLSAAASVTWNADVGQVAQLIPDQNFTLANITNARSGGVYILEITQPSSGGPHTITFGSNYVHPGGTPPILSTGADETDILTVVVLSPSILAVTAQLNFS